MKKSLPYLMLLLTNMFFISCIENNDVIEEEVCVKENYAVSFERQIAEILVEPTNWRYIGKTMDFTYNEFNLLERMSEGNIDSYHVYGFQYLCNNQVSEMFNKKYKFNEQNNLTTVTKESSNKYLDLIYSGNTVNLKGNMYSSEEKDITFFVNSDNLVTKIQRSDNYSILHYDANGNLINAKDYNLNGTLLKEFEFEFDQNPNPFYGQLSSAYFERVYYYFQNSVTDGVNYMAYNSNFDMYFPYFKNNPLKIINKSMSAPYNVTMQRDYTYDADNYPVKFEYTTVGYHDSTISITYKE